MPLEDLQPGEMQLIAATWNFRARAERSARLRFTRLAETLSEEGVPEQILTMAHTAIEDETRHIKLCDTLAESFGWDRPIGPPTPHGAIGPTDGAPGDRLLFEMVAFCCVTETINAAMLLEVRRIVEEPQIRETVQAILKDEVNHSKLGWAYLQHARNQGRGAFLPKWLPKMFYGAGVEEIYAEDNGSREAPHLAAYGELSFGRRTGIFRASMRDIVLPGLETMGVETMHGRQWLSEYEPTLATPTS